MIGEVEIELHALAVRRDRRGGEAARGDIKRRVPGMIDPGGAGEPVFAYDLRPQLQGGAGLLPGRKWDVRPAISHALCLSFSPAE